MSDNLYSLDYLQEQVFYTYSSINSYITPYSSDKQGGELLTEYNQRVSLNILLRRRMDFSSYAREVEALVNDKFGVLVEVDQTTGETQKSAAGLNSFLETSLHYQTNWHALAFATGTEGPNDFKLSIPAESGNSKLSISSGRALVYGYSVESVSEVLIDTSDIMTIEDVALVAGNEGQVASNPFMTKFVKLAVMYTEGPNTRHDERLVPPANNAYLGAAIVINDELPAKNELLLGTISRDSTGIFFVTNNSLKTRMMPLDGVAGTENYDSLVDASNIDWNTIYGVERRSWGNNLTPISSWLWLHENSNLGLLLKQISVEPDTAGQEDDRSTRGLIVTQGNTHTSGNLSSAIQKDTNSQYPSIYWWQAYALRGNASASEERRDVYFPFAYQNADTGILKVEVSGGPGSEDPTVHRFRYSDEQNPELATITGQPGFMTPQQVYMLETLYQNRNHTGTMYGPFLTVADAANWLQQSNLFFNVGDYFWVLNDVRTEPNDSTVEDTEEVLTANFGTVSGTITGSATGTVTGTVTGTIKEQSVTATTLDNEINVDFDAAVGETQTAANITIPSFLSTIRQVDLDSITMTDEEGNTYTGSGRGDSGAISTDALAGVDIQGNARGTGPSEYTITIQPEEVSGDVTGNVRGILTGTATGTLNSFAQNVSTRYVCLKEGRGINFITQFVQWVNESTGEPFDTPVDAIPRATEKRGGAPHTGDAIFAAEAVERGFAIPATPNTYGLVKTGDGTALEDVLLNSNTNRLRVSDMLLDRVMNGGFEADSNTFFELNPSNLSFSWSSWTNHIFTDATGVTFKMTGLASAWEAIFSEENCPRNMRGHITFDYSEVIVDDAYAGGLLLKFKNLDWVTLKGNNSTVDNHKPTSALKFGFDHCVVDSPFFENIAYWTASEFTSGSNTLELKNPWMKVSDVFTNTVDNNLYARFSSITMGEAGIVSAMMDMWIQYEGWSDNPNSIDKCWVSLKRINFPPFAFEFLEMDSDSVTTGSVNLETIQYIPSDLNLKIGATAGVHEFFNTANSTYQVSGNLLTTVDWEYNGNPEVGGTPAGRLYLNLYMKNSGGDSSQKFSNLRFRVPVQIIRTDTNSFSECATYQAIFQKEPEN